LGKRNGNRRVGTEPIEASEQAVRHPVQRPQGAVTQFAIEDVTGDAVNVRGAEVAHGEGTQLLRRGASWEIRGLVHVDTRHPRDSSLSLPKRPDVTQSRDATYNVSTM